MENILENFACNVFNDSVMKQRLSKNAYDAIQNAKIKGEPLSAERADEIAEVIKNWAIEKGATHYCHWFQPMTEVTAEKHDAFLSKTKDNKIIIEFSGKELIKGEPDASSLPSGGLRATFEARGYTAWDVSSPIFLKTNGTVTSLYIPCAFFSQNGDVLDKKTPLLRSMDALNKEALKLLRAIGDTQTERVFANLGAEQEYFLIPRDLANKRLDLKLCGRTLFGELAAKGQEMNDHYFGTINKRVATFMQSVNMELWKLGVSAKTFHNEVAPAQFELAPLYDTVNIATDQNQLIMEVLRRTARDQDFKCLLHEKPFEGINGSGKHNNYSLCTDKGENLLSPGKDPKNNLKFLLFICAFIKGVDTYQGLLRSSAATAGNDHRLGGHEAPPGIISIFLGEDIYNALYYHTEKEINLSQKSKQINLTSSVHNVNKDISDRNRTSPLAFTGNKFEFRMVGSQQSTSAPNFILNTILAEMFSQFAEKLEKSKDVNKTIIEIINTTLKENGRILFNGDNYSKEWKAEAKKRGLLNLKTTPDALKYLADNKSGELFEKHGVLSPREQHARYEIYMNRYANAVIMEGIVFEKMLSREIIPAAFDYSSKLSMNINQITKAGCNVPKSSVCKVNKITSNIDDLELMCKELANTIVSAKKNGDPEKRAIYVKNNLIPLLDKTRGYCDNLETLLGKEAWPIPSYTELLFSL
ncbi:MAG: glutamine synthetase III [Abditibacteriota bacterium]|nr:glutamine synthetase III [Abditibacteriota bacterium]